MIIKKHIVLLLIFISGNLFSQQININGFVIDSITGESLVSANIYTSDYKYSAISNNYGYFSFTIPQHYKKFFVSYLGYYINEVKIDSLHHNIILNINMAPNATIEEIKIYASPIIQEVRNQQLGVSELHAAKIEQLPNFLGEPDILKTFQLLPGIQAGNAGSTGLFVRGSDPGQSLILLDGTPVYNANHLYGFFSVFNSDAINSAILYKGAFPTKYGSRASAVLDISMKEGRNDKTSVKGTVGLIASKILIEGPIIKDKLTYLISARRTYFDLPIKAYVFSKQKDPDNRSYTAYHFYDGTCKVNYRFNNKHRIFISYYGGNDDYISVDNKKDELEIDKTKETYKWGNTTASLRYTFSINKSIFYSAQAYCTDYYYKLIKDNTNYIISEKRYNSYSNKDYKTKIRDYGFNTSISINKNKNHNFEAGLGITNHNFDPSSGQITIAEYGSQPYELSFSQDKMYITDSYGYFQDKIKISEKINSTAGIRVVFNDLNNISPQFEPRIQLQYLPKDIISTKIGYGRVTQNCFMVTTNNMFSPADLWVFKTENMEPLISNQIDAGCVIAVSDHYKVTFETYYKSLKNLLEVKEGYKFDILENWEESVVQGNGDAYGFETMLERRYTRLSGWVGYSLAWSNRQFDALNNGKEYRFKYDRRHNISIVLLYKLTDRMDINLTWLYASGSLITLATNIVQDYRASTDIDINGISRLNHEYASSKNNVQLPDFHRLDLSFNYTKQKKKYVAKWNFGVYNLYNRQNACFITRDNINNKESYYLTGLYPFFPFISYSFNF